MTALHQSLHASMPWDLLQKAVSVMINHQQQQAPMLARSSYIVH
jgi:hypothetical protein